MVVLYDVGTITVVEGNTRPTVRPTALDGIPPNGHTIKIPSIDAAVGIGKGIAADLQTRGRAAAVTTG